MLGEADSQLCGTAGGVLGAGGWRLNRFIATFEEARGTVRRPCARRGQRCSYSVLFSESVCSHSLSVCETSVLGGRARCITLLLASVLRSKWIRTHYLLVLFRISRVSGEESRPDSSRCRTELFKDLF